MNGLLAPVEHRWVDNNPVPAAGFTFGDTITFATAHTKTAWITLDGMSALAFDAEELWIISNAVSGAAGANTSCLLDIGFGATDPVNERIVVPNLMVGYTGPPRGWKIPVRIPSGSAVKARAQIADITRSLEFFVAARGSRVPWHDHVPSRRVTAYGPNLATSRGVDVTAGNAVYGTYVTLGTTTRHHQGFFLSVQGGGDTTLVAASFFLAIRFGTAGNPQIVDIVAEMSASGYFSGPSVATEPIWLPIPSGTVVQAAAAMDVFNAGAAVIDVALYGL